MATYFMEVVVLSFLAGGLMAAVAVFQIKNRNLAAAKNAPQRSQRP